MTRRTKKVRSVGRFGARYGVRIRRRIQEVEAEQRKRHRCPRCLAVAVKRRSTGVWACGRCGHVFAGGAYRPVVTTALRGEVIAVEEAEEKKPGEVA